MSRTVQDEYGVHRIECCRTWPSSHGDKQGQEQGGRGHLRKGKRILKEQKERAKGRRAKRSRGGVTTGGKWGHKAANCWHGEEKQVHQVQGRTAKGQLKQFAADSDLTNDVGATDES